MFIDQRSKVDHGLDHWLAGGASQPKAELFAHALHLDVLGEDVAGDPGDLLVATDLEQAVEQRGAQSLPLEFVSDQECELGLVGLADLAQPADAEDLQFAGRGVLTAGHQGHFAIVVDEADPGQALVGDPRTERDRVEVAARDGTLGERAVELHQQGLVLGADGPEQQLLTVLGGPGGDVPARVRKDRRPGDVRVAHVGLVNDYPRVQRQQAIGRSQ